MKLSGRDAARFLAKPDPAAAGILLYGADAMRVALKRAALVETLLGPEAAAEMRLTRMTGAETRRDPAAVIDAMKAVGFFPGPRAVLIEEATDAVAEIIRVALADWRRGDATLVATAGALAAGSGLRKAFEAMPAAVAIGVYTDPPGAAEIDAALARAGIVPVGREAKADIEALARELDPGDFAQFVEKLALYRLGAPGEAGPEDIAACAPPVAEAEVEALLDLAADGRAAAVIVELARFGTIGRSPTTFAIAAGRHFRALHAAAISRDPEAALGRMRPPVFGARRARMAAQARAFGPERLERAVGWITDADLDLRSAQPLPGFALIERLFVRIALLRGSDEG